MAETDGTDPPVEIGTEKISGFLTYSGTMTGFAAVRTEASVGEDPQPETVHTRSYLRNGLPGIYRDDGNGDFAMRFVGALENVLDPIVAIVDTLPAHFNPSIAPVDVLELITNWLGVEYDEAQPIAQLRALVRHSPELGRLRGTRSGLDLALKLNFPDLPLRIEDQGTVTWSTDVNAAPESTRPSFIVYCDKPIGEDRQAAVARLIEAMKPVHVRYRLRVKAPKAKPKPS